VKVPPGTGEFNMAEPVPRIEPRFRLNRATRPALWLRGAGEPVAAVASPIDRVAIAIRESP